jgi:SAM-dependent methyltransferase
MTRVVVSWISGRASMEAADASSAWAETGLAARQLAHIEEVVSRSFRKQATSVLDLGCGDGRALARLSGSLASDARVSLWDANRCALERAVAHASHYSTVSSVFVGGFATTHHPPDAELVISICSLHHLPQRQKIRVLRPLLSRGATILVGEFEAALAGLERDDPRLRRAASSLYGGFSATLAKEATGAAASVLEGLIMPEAWRVSSLCRDRRGEYHEDATGWRRVLAEAGANSVLLDRRGIGEGLTSLVVVGTAGPDGCGLVGHAPSLWAPLPSRSEVCAERLAATAPPAPVL